MCVSFHKYSVCGRHRQHWPLALCVGIVLGTNTQSNRHGWKRLDASLPFYRWHCHRRRRKLNWFFPRCVSAIRTNITRMVDKEFVDHSFFGVQSMPPLVQSSAVDLENLLPLMLCVSTKCDARKKGKTFRLVFGSWKLYGDKRKTKMICTIVCHSMLRP